MDYFGVPGKKLKKSVTFSIIKNTIRQATY